MLGNGEEMRKKWAKSISVIIIISSFYFFRFFFSIKQVWISWRFLWNFPSFSLNLLESLRISSSSFYARLSLKKIDEIHEWIQAGIYTGFEDFADFLDILGFIQFYFWYTDISNPPQENRMQDSRKLELENRNFGCFA